MTPNFSAPACTHPNAVAALALGPSGACQTYQSPPQPPGPRRGGRLSALSAQFSSSSNSHSWRGPEETPSPEPGRLAITLLLDERPILGHILESLDASSGT